MRSNDVIERLADAEPRAVMRARIDIEVSGLGDRGHRYRVTHAGTVLVDGSRNPEFDACRALGEYQDTMASLQGLLDALAKGAAGRRGDLLSGRDHKWVEKKFDPGWQRLERHSVCEQERAGNRSRRHERVEFSGAVGDQHRRSFRELVEAGRAWLDAA